LFVGQSQRANQHRAELRLRLPRAGWGRNQQDERGNRNPKR
jgi:hypothetical protein